MPGHVMVEMSRPDDPASLAEFEALLAYLKQTRGFDFTSYKRTSLMRRVLLRMQTLGVRGFATYLDFLQRHPEESTRLFNTILINVTSFFRDTTNWEFVRDEVVPMVVRSSTAKTPIRIWSAGCASGEEAYSIAILLAEAVGLDNYRKRVQVYATDVDEEALSQARYAAYGSHTPEDVPAPLLEKYFDRRQDRYVLSRELRRSFIFGRHDLLQDAPISRVDLLICRNCLMYFNADAQTKIMGRFHFALVPRGVLFLGKAELPKSAMFEPLDVKRRLFVKTQRAPEMRHGTTFTTATETDRIRHLRQAASAPRGVLHLMEKPDGRG